MEQVFSYIISLGASVMMPILFTIIGLCIGMKFGKSLKSGLYVGVGFVGLGIVTALLTNNFGGPLSEISTLYDLQLGVFDMGWPAAAAVAYRAGCHRGCSDWCRCPVGYQEGALPWCDDGRCDGADSSYHETVHRHHPLRGADRCL